MEQRGGAARENADYNGLNPCAPGTLTRRFGLTNAPVVSYFTA